MKNLKHIIIVAIFMTACFTAGFYLSRIQEKLFPSTGAKELDSSITAEADDNAAVTKTSISVENFKDIPHDLPEGWSKVEITTKLPAVALGSDFSNYDSFTEGGHNSEDGFELAIFGDEKYDFYITNPTINTEIAEKCSENGFGVLAVSIYDKEGYDLRTKVIFYDQAKPITLTILPDGIEVDEPVIRYSGGAFGGLSEITFYGNEEDQPALWNVINEDLLEGYYFNPFCIQVYNVYFRNSDILLIDNISAAISEIDKYVEYQKELNAQFADYAQVIEYFDTGIESEDYSEFDLEGYIKEHGGTATTSFESSYLNRVDSETGEAIEPILDSVKEIMNIQINDLNIVVFYQYEFMAMDDVLYDVAVNGRVVTYDDVHENNREYRHEDLSSEVKIGKEAKIDRATFDYVLDLITKNSNE